MRLHILIFKIVILLSLSGCFGSTLFTIGGIYKVTIGDVITKTARVIPKIDDNKEDYENKKL